MSEDSVARPTDYMSTIEQGIECARTQATWGRLVTAQIALDSGQIPDDIDDLVRLAKEQIAEYGGPAR